MPVNVFGEEGNLADLCGVRRMVTGVLRIKPARRQCFVALAFALICSRPQMSDAETLTLATYYPAPYGAYLAILTTNKTLLARDGGAVGIGYARMGPTAKLAVKGNVGIGTSTPASRLDVYGGVRLGEDSSDCETGNEGTQRYNAGLKRMEYCDGSGEWKPFGGGRLPDTGQTTSYGVGDDACYNPAGAQMSYTVNGDNTVTDNITGLMWRRCSQGMNDDATCTGTAMTYSWTKALEECEKETADYSDWRLPNFKELISLLKYEGTTYPLIDNTTFPATIGGEPGHYWTSTTLSANTALAQAVLFYGGTVASDPKTSNFYVRCVRGGL